MDKLPVSAGSITCQGYKWDIPSPKEVVCLIHGIGEHARRYAHVAAHFNAHGFAFYGFDLPGHGVSPLARGHLGSPKLVDQLVDALVAQARQDHPGVPITIYGHSLGGALALKYSFDTADRTLRFIVTAPWLILADPPPRSKVILSRVMSKLVPSFAVTTDLDPAVLSHDPEVVKAYISDPLVHGKISAMSGVICFDTAEGLIHRAGEHQMPVLLMHGTEDRICDIRGSREFAAKAGKTCTFVEWPGMFHEIHNEPDKQKVLDKMTTWLMHEVKKGL